MTIGFGYRPKIYDPTTRTVSHFSSYRIQLDFIIGLIIRLIHMAVLRLWPSNQFIKLFIVG